MKVQTMKMQTTEGWEPREDANHGGWEPWQSVNHKSGNHGRDTTE